MFNQNIQCKKILSLFLVLSGSAFLSGCVYHNYGSPHINGIITDQGQTLAGVKVSLANFDQKVQTTTTDTKGHFSFIPQGEWNVFIPIGPQDRMNNWSIIIEQGPLEITGYKRSHLGGAFSGYSYRDHITLVCDVSLSRKDIGDSDNNPVCRPDIDSQ